MPTMKKTLNELLGAAPLRLHTPYHPKVSTDGPFPSSAVLLMNQNHPESITDDSLTILKLG